MRWRRRVSIGVAGLLVAAAAPFAASGFPAAGAAATRDTCSAVTGAALASHGWINEPAGTHLSCLHVDSKLGLQRTFWVYLPPSWNARSTMPLVVMLHGCTEQAPDIAYISRIDWEAAKRNFVVLFPEQANFQMTGTTTFDGNGSRCWNWFLPQGQDRGAGEPALIAGITTWAIGSTHADRSRVYVIGVSAGAATADIMAATYPELYAAAGVVAGCEYKGLPCFGSVAAQPPEVSAQLAYQAGGAHARVVPFIVENGDTDPVVPVANAFEVAQQLLITADYAQHHGSLMDPLPRTPCNQTHDVPPGNPVDTSRTPPVVRSAYDVYYFRNYGGPCSTSISDPNTLGEVWIVHGEFHAWPGGPQPTSGEIYTNPGGPDFADAAYRFFMAHPCRLAAGVCAPGR